MRGSAHALIKQAKKTLLTLGENRSWMVNNCSLFFGQKYHPHFLVRNTTLTFWLEIPPKSSRHVQLILKLDLMPAGNFLAHAM